MNYLRRKPKYLEITEELWKKAQQETLSGIVALLDSSKKLLENGGNEAICAGLYSYAVEEYGKILLLKQYNPTNEKVKIKYKDEFTKHEDKFDTAIRKLPKECVNLRRTGFEEGFENGFEHKEIIADFESRMAIFYSDFDDSGIEIKSVPPIDKDKLKNAIEKLSIIAFGMNFPKQNS